jgi:hypothetical protein
VAVEAPLLVGQQGHRLVELYLRVQFGSVQSSVRDRDGKRWKYEAAISSMSEALYGIQVNKALQEVTERLPKVSKGERVGETEELLSHTRSHL